MSANQEFGTTPRKNKGEDELRLINSPAQKVQDLYEALINCSPPRRLFLHEEEPSSQIEEEDQYSSEMTPEEQQSEMTPEIKNKANEEQAARNQYYTVRKVTTPKKEGRGCNCEKSHCLKKYCDCFKIGEVCGPECNCLDCKNVVITQEHQKQAKVLEMTRSGKGKELKCNCQKSHCLKNYCECHSAGRMCSSACNCTQCENKIDSTPKNRRNRQFLTVSDWTEEKPNKQNVLFN